MIRKHYKKFVMIMLLIIAVLAVSAFQISNDAEETVSAVPELIEVVTPMISATGEIVPQQHAMLSLSTGGVVS